MEQRIKRVLLALRINFVAMWVIAVILMVAGEMDVWVDHMFEPQSQDEYVVNCVCIALVFGVAGGMTLFNLNTTNSLRRMNKDEALNFYYVWSMVRGGFMAVCIWVGIMGYYLTLSTTGAFCALIGMTLSLYCLPTRKRIDCYLESINNDV